MGERVGAGADPAAGSGDDRGWLERELRERADGMERMGRHRSPLVALLREAADAVGEARRAMEGGRRLFRDPGETCGCEDCRALRAIDMALARLGEGG